MDTETENRLVRETATDIDRALLRMKRAADRGTGCHLTAEMIDALSTTIFAQCWTEAASDLAANQ